MKLLYCSKCHYIFNLSSTEIRQCRCGKTKDYYLDDGLNAKYSGEYAIPIRFNTAILNQLKKGIGENFEAFVIPKKCKTFVKED